MGRKNEPQPNQQNDNPIKPGLRSPHLTLATHLLANSKRAQEALGWQPQYPDLYTIIRHSWLSF
ncbi:MAG: hypothetical protein DRR16_25430 [Candidatus Parabeggiatoa sp. nov. 3]|nr:MAG: hypothetical protein DRR00_25835 [Gammaproteobacteria bacterium]RKZ59133.1 MAG: hypothetical protein DRQ99_24245 [Gammaproteobacteria bacterium]RKZ79586.1 MAG: hypothetical protein DRR16_25430 [Gammaproteobacteria bacterium]